MARSHTSPPLPRKLGTSCWLGRKRAAQAGVRTRARVTLRAESAGTVSTAQLRPRLYSRAVSRSTSAGTGAAGDWARTGPHSPSSAPSSATSHPPRKGPGFRGRTPAKGEGVVFISNRFSVKGALLNK